MEWRTSRDRRTSYTISGMVDDAGDNEATAAQVLALGNGEKEMESIAPGWLWPLPWRAAWESPLSTDLGRAADGGDSVLFRDWEAAAALIGANGHLNNHSSAFYNTATAQTFLRTTTWTLLSNRNMQGHCNTKYYCNNGYHWKDQPSSHQHSRDKGEPGLTNYTEGKNRNEIGKLHDIVNDGGINQNISPGRPLIHLGCAARCSHLIEMH